MAEASKLTLRMKVFKQEVLNGTVRLVALCRNAGSLSEAECEEIEERIKKETPDDMGFDTSLESVFKD